MMVFRRLFFVKHVCSWAYGLIVASTFSVYTRNSYRGVYFEKECQQLQFCASCSQNEVLWDLRKVFLDIFYICLVVFRGKCTTKFKFQLRSIPIQSPLGDYTTFFQKCFAVSSKSPFQKKIILETISDKICETRFSSPFILCWLQIGSLFLVFTASHGFFRRGTTLSQGKGESG